MLCSWQWFECWSYLPFSRLLDPKCDLSLGLSTTRYQTIVNSINSFSLVLSWLVEDVYDDEAPDISRLGWYWTCCIPWMWLLTILPRSVMDFISDSRRSTRRCTWSGWTHNVARVMEKRDSHSPEFTNLNLDLKVFIDQLSQVLEANSPGCPEYCRTGYWPWVFDGVTSLQAEIDTTGFLALDLN